MSDMERREGDLVDFNTGALRKGHALVQTGPAGVFFLGFGPRLEELARFAFEDTADTGPFLLLCRGVASAVESGQWATARSSGVPPEVFGIEDSILRRFAIADALAKAGYSPDEPRDDHGRWTSDGGKNSPPSPKSRKPYLVEVGDNRDVPNAVLRDQTGSLTPLLVVDFSGGFHDAVVAAFMKFYRDRGVPAVQNPTIRIIGPDPQVIGLPDIIIRDPDLGPGWTVVEIKTGENPSFTPMQRLYLPMMQLGGHIYTLDPRIVQLGLTPGVPFPPMEVLTVYAPGPGLKYGYRFLPKPRFED